MKYPAICEHHLYNKTYRQGKKFFGRYVCVYVLKDLKAKKLSLMHPRKIRVNRLGLAVSKKIGGAVVRNRAKRIIRAAYATVEDKLYTGNLIVISAKPEIVGKKSNEIAKELQYAFLKLQLIGSNGMSAEGSGK